MHSKCWRGETQHILLYNFNRWVNIIHRKENNNNVLDKHLLFLINIVFRYPTSGYDDDHELELFLS